MTEGVKELSDLLLVRLHEVSTRDRLKGEHEEFYNRMIPELDKLKVDLMIKRPPDTTRPDGEGSSSTRTKSSPEANCKVETSGSS